VLLGVPSQSDHRRRRIDTRRRPTPDSLPTWPITAMFVPYLLWWGLGIGDAIWGLMAVPMLAYLASRRRHVRVPRGFGLWLLFLGWMLVSVIEIDSGGRLFGFAFRVLIYLGATVAFVYVYNCDRRTLPIEFVAAVMTGFWVLIIIGGYLALALPHGSITTPLSYVMPHGLASNDLVHQMIAPRFTQGDPNGYFHLALRPSAPFAFTNAWGTNYTLTLPFVFITLMRLRRGPLFWLLIALIPVSLAPAFSTQNRGMLLALGVGVAYVAVREIKRGHMVGIVTVLLFLGAAAGMTTVVPVDQMIQQRVSSSDTNDTRLAVYGEAITRTKESPLIGRGAPRPSHLGPAAPSVGTQGQFWMVLFSHGFVGVILFMAWFVSVIVRTAKAPTTVTLWLHGILVMQLLESIYYGMLGSAIVITMITGALLIREQAAVSGRPRRPGEAAIVPRFRHADERAAAEAPDPLTDPAGPGAGQIGAGQIGAGSPARARL
jgi:polysaccharide biosynthesis protein PslJ